MLKSPARLATGLAALGFLLPAPAHAYSSVGDRTFQATIIVPQIAPTDEFYLRTTSLRMTALPFGGDRRLTNLSAVYSKTITERLGLTFENGYNWLTRSDAATRTGFQNLEATLRYIAVLAPDDEFLLTAGVRREFGTGAQRIGAEREGGTQPTLYFGKGLGGLGLESLRPLAIKGAFGYQFSDGDRPDLWIGNLAVEYSIPYLQSKVRAFDLPDFVQRLTPQVEVQVTTPDGGGRPTTALVAPGISYAGEGWEVALAALLPVTRGSGEGVGVGLQFHLSLEFFFPTMLGKPLLSP